MADPAKTVATCPEHVLPLLDERKVEAYVTLLDWTGMSVVVHACEARLEIAKEERVI